MANTGLGIAIYSGAAFNTIGGSAAGAGNLISGNLQHGLGIYNSGTTNNVVQGNRIGTNAAGTAALGNGFNNAYAGVTIQSGATNNLIGGPTAAAGNLISGNQNDGVGVFAANSNTIENNFIGTDVTGTFAIANGGPAWLSSAGRAITLCGPTSYRAMPATASM